MRMSFGKHKGELVWVVNNCTRINPWLKTAIEQELQHRCKKPADVAPGPPPAPLSDIIRTWYREMALRWHPDRGGSDDAMKAINHAHERLKQLAEVP
jgi:hypothetical protein